MNPYQLLFGPLWPTAPKHELRELIHHQQLEPIKEQVDPNAI